MNQLPIESPAKDPVCGMDVNTEVASVQGLLSEHDGHTYWFCGRGCKLNFDDHPSRYLDPGHVPSM